jgi:hypothetical protein
MQGLQQSYTQYFNRSYRRVGHLFQGRYKAIICDKDKYLLALLRYIHFNPVRAGLAKRPEGYVYSGHRRESFSFMRNSMLQTDRLTATAELSVKHLLAT